MILFTKNSTLSAIERQHIDICAYFLGDNRLRRVTVHSLFTVVNVQYIEWRIQLEIVKRARATEWNHFNTDRSFICDIRQMVIPNYYSMLLLFCLRNVVYIRVDFVRLTSQANALLKFCKRHTRTRTHIARTYCDDDGMSSV